MNNKRSLQKKLVTAVASAFMISAAAAPMMSDHVQAAATFKDVPAGAFYEKAVQTLSEKGVIGGYSDGTFKPSKAVTRAEAAKMLAADLGLQTAGQAAANFKDVKNTDWFYGPVTALSQAGGIGGYENGTFQPNKTITRAEMASMLIKAYSLQENEDAEKAPFADVNASSWYAGAIQTLYGNKITSGKTATKFAPNDSVTRGEIAAFINKVNEAKNSQGSTGTGGTENKDSSIIEKISEDGSTVTVSGQAYKIPASLSGILSKENAAVLANAKIDVEAANGQITKITYLQLNTSGQEAAGQEFANNLVLDGKGKTINGTLEVNANYITVKNVTITGNLEITSKLTNDFYSENITVNGQTLVNGGDSNTVVFKNAKLGTVAINKKDVRVEPKGNTSIKELSINTNATVAADENASLPKTTINNGADNVKLDGPFGTVELKNNKAATLKGTADIKELQVKENTNLSIEVENKIAKVTAVKGSKFSIDEDTAIGHLEIPYGIQASDVISNFNDRKNNIEKTNNEVNADYKAPKSTAGGGGGGGGGAAATTPTADSILNGYKNQLENLKNSAKNDFSSLKSDFLNGNVSFTNALDQGQAKYNYYKGEFDNTYNKLVNELKENGYSEDKAQVVKDEFDSLVGPYKDYLE